MEREMSNHLKIAVASISCFTDDGTLDLGELNYLIGLALGNDGVIDEDEKEVFRSLFSKISESEVTPSVWNRISEVKKMYDI